MVLAHFFNHERPQVVTLLAQLERDLLTLKRIRAGDVVAEIFGGNSKSRVPIRQVGQHCSPIIEDRASPSSS